MKQGEKELLSPEQFDEAVDELKKASLDTQALKSFLRDCHPADMAQLMAVLPLAQSQKLLAPLLATKKLAATLIELPENYIEDFLADLPKRLLADVVTELEPDDAVDLLQYLDKKLREQILGLLTKVQARELRKLLYYGEDTAGALMDPRCLSLLDSFTVQEAIDAVRANRNRFESIYYVYIVDRKRNLVGIVKVSNLLFVSPRDELSSVMHRDL